MTAIIMKFDFECEGGMKQCGKRFDLRVTIFSFLSICFNTLPMDNLILNIYNERLNKTIIELDNNNMYLDESNKIKDVFINIIHNNSKNLNETINSSEIGIKLMKIKEWYETKNK